MLIIKYNFLENMIENQPDGTDPQGTETSRVLYIQGFNETTKGDFKKAHFGKRRKLKTESKVKNFSNIIFNHNVNRLVNTFISNLRFNSIYREACDDYGSDFSNSKSRMGMFFLRFLFKKIANRQGFDVGNLFLIIWCLISIIHITTMVIIFSILITFPQTQHQPVIEYLKIISIGIYLIDMILSMTIKHYGGGKSLQKIGEISKYYLKNQFVIDIASILIFPIDIIFNVQTDIQIFLFVLAIIKQVTNLHKFSKFQYIIIDTSWKEHYYGLIKILLFNFVIGHFLSVILNFLPCLNHHKNWYSKVDIQNDPWYTKYIWGYYWGTNIMLTVGFGDISATNTHEAFALILIEAFSCITLAYNINYVGVLVGNIKENQKIKKKKLQIFHRMCKENFIQKEIQSNVANFIEVEHKVKEEFQYAAQDQLLKNLPLTIQKKFRQEANKNLFDNLGFLSNFLKKGLVGLAEKIQRRVYHPQQIVFKRGSVPNFWVLQSGSLGLVCRIKSILDGLQIDNIKIQKGDKPIMPSFHFIKNKEINYNVKSNDFSVIFFLSVHDLIECIRKNDLSFETFLMIKDRKNQGYQTDNVKCSLCKNSCHTKFDCSRLHYMPLSSYVIYRHLHSRKKSKQGRFSGLKRQKYMMTTLPNSVKIMIGQKRFIEDRYGDEHLKEVEDLCNFYSSRRVTLEDTHENTRRHSQKRSNFYEKERIRSSITKKSMSKELQTKLMTISKFEKLIQRKQCQPSDFWQLQCEIANNYKFYFKDWNSDVVKWLKPRLNQSNKFLF